MILPFLAFVIALCCFYIWLRYKSHKCNKLIGHAEPNVDEAKPEHEWMGCIMTRSGKTYPIIQKSKEKD